MADLVFIVSRSEPKQYLYLKHQFADESRDVVLDRRTGERRRSPMTQPRIERRHIDRRQRDITRELQSSGWALVRRPVTYIAFERKGGDKGGGGGQRRLSLEPILPQRFPPGSLD
jgi:hypothetical protein